MIFIMPRPTLWQRFLFMFGLFRQSGVGFWWTMSALTLTAILTLILPFSIRHVIDLSWETLLQPKMLFLGSGLMLGLALGTAARYYHITLTSETLYHQLRARLFAHLTRFSADDLAPYPYSDLIARLSHDCAQIRDFISSALSIALRNSILLIGGLIMMGLSNWRMMLGAFIILPLLMAPFLWGIKRLKKAKNTAQQQADHGDQLLHEVLMGFSTMVHFNREAHHQKQLETQSAHSLKASHAKITERAILTFFIILMIFGIIIGIALYGAHAIASNALTLGELTQFMLYSMLTAMAAVALTEIMGALQKVSTSYERIFTLLKTQPTQQDTNNAPRLPAFQSLSLTSASFTYPERGGMLFDQINFILKAGEKIGIVGPSGQGKSSLLKLIMRDHALTSGTYLWNDHPINHYKLRDLRASISLVSQHITLFSGSIFDNIAYGKENATRDEVIMAAKNAQIHSDIMAMEKGYDTDIGDFGHALSGGQKQRLVIARAVLKDAPIWLLDEPSSALDSVTEAALMETLKTLTQDKTVLMISHRLESLSHMDRLYACEEGRIKEVK